MTTTDRFADLTRDQQGELLRSRVATVLPRLGLDGELDLVAQGYNTTFRVEDPARGPVAVRVNVDSPRGPAEVGAELTWVSALAEAGVAVPTPVLPADGEVPVVAVPGLRDDAPVAAYHWVDGEDLGALFDEPARRSELLDGLALLGGMLARLQDHARDFALPPGLTRPAWTSWRLGSDDHLARPDDRWASDAVLATIDAARSEVEAATAAVLGDTAEHRLAHADLHGWNAKLDAGRLVVFDFDDAGVTAPLFDLAIAVFYLRDDEAAEDAFLRGVAAANDLGADLVDAVGEPVFEALLASRQLLMLNDLVGSPQGGWDDVDLREYADRTRRRLAHWLDTGRFLLDPPA